MTTQSMVLSEDTLDEWVRPLVAEFIGPFALVFMGVGSILLGGDIVAVALAHGLAIGLTIAATGHISGGSFNPAITLGFVIGRRITPLMGVAYVVVELLGAAAAAIVLVILFPSEIRDPVHLGTPAIGAGFSAGQGMGIELVLTFFLMYVVYGTALDKRGPSTIASLAIGLTITMGVLAAGNATGAAMNPARSFGPALIDGHWDDAWVYWVGPAIGAAIAALLFHYILVPPGKDRHA